MEFTARPTSSSRSSRHDPSPRSRREARLYARHGVREYWAVDPQDETVTLDDLERTPDQARSHAAGATVSSRVLAGFALDVGDLFRSA
jgi:Uma2 family endonuclease